MARVSTQKKADALKDEGKQETIFEMVKRPNTERIFPPLPTLTKFFLEEDEELASNFSEFDPSFDLVCVVSVLPIEYDVPSEVNEVESDFTEEMTIHRPLC